jgi:hypothetical protein
MECMVYASAKKVVRHLWDLALTLRRSEVLEDEGFDFDAL